MKKHKDKRLKEFESLANPLRGQLYATALRLSRNLLDAEDLVQDTYVKAWQYFHKYEPGTNFCAWIRRIVTNNLINQWRTRTIVRFFKNWKGVCHEKIVCKLSISTLDI